MSRTYTLPEAISLMDGLERNFATLIGVANIDVVDVFGEDEAPPRALFLERAEGGGDRATPYARRLARMLVDRLVHEYDIVPLESQGQES